MNSVIEILVLALAVTMAAIGISVGLVYVREASTLLSDGNASAVELTTTMLNYNVDKLNEDTVLGKDVKRLVEQYENEDVVLNVQTFKYYNHRAATWLVGKAFFIDGNRLLLSNEKDALAYFRNADINKEPAASAHDYAVTKYISNYADDAVNNDADSNFTNMYYRLSPTYIKDDWTFKVYVFHDANGILNQITFIQQ